ncbi:MAG: hypothetical protein RJA70_1017 [Pseudomonadota bacterium]|jgi:multidrug resistance efflux pump
MKRRISTASVVAVVVLLGAGALVFQHLFAQRSGAPSEKQITAAQSRTLTPAAGATDERRPLPEGDWLPGDGVIEPKDRETRLASSVGGRIASVLVHEGEPIEMGALVIQLDDTLERASVVAAESELAITKAEAYRTGRGVRKEEIEAVAADFEALTARARLSSEVLTRAEGLAAAGAISATELDSARATFEVDRASLASVEAKKRAAVAGSRLEDISIALARVQAAEARLAQATAARSQREVRSPISGQVLQLKVRAGEYYNPLGSEPLALLGDTSELRVRVDIDERNVAKLSLGMRGFVTLSAFGDRRFPGKVISIGERMGRKNLRTDDPTERIDTKILEVVMALDDAAGLRTGLRVSAFLEAPQK